MEDSGKSPSKAPQRRGACGHIMAAFDQHQRCSRCREAKKGQDLCVLGEPCHLCDVLTPEQVKQLATPKYRERKEKAKASATSTSTVDVDPSLVTVLGSPTPEDRAAVKNTGTDKGKKKKASASTTPVKSQLVKDREPGTTSLLKSPAPDRTGSDLPLRRDISVSQMDLTAMAMAIREELAQKEQQREEERAQREQARKDLWAERFARLEARMISSTFNPPSTSASQPAPAREDPEPEPEDCDEPSQEPEIELDTQESDLDVSDPSPESEDQAVDRPPPSSSFQNQPHVS